nr:hypothetical protein [Cupriavidus taiwanensis]
MENQKQIPKDFPHRYIPAVLPGTQPKLCVRERSDGTYGSRETAEERYERRQTCEALLWHIRTVVAESALGDSPNFKPLEILERARAAVPYRVWLTPDELDWVEHRLLTSDAQWIHT